MEDGCGRTVKLAQQSFSYNYNTSGSGLSGESQTSERLEHFLMHNSSSKTALTRQTPLPFNQPGG